MLGRSREEGWYPGWVSWERSEFSRILVVTKSLSNKTLCTRCHQPLVCTHPLLRLHTAVQESTWPEDGLSWVHLPSRSHSGLSLPSHHQVCVPAQMTHIWEVLGRGFTISLWKSFTIRQSQLPQIQYFLFLLSLEGWGPSVRAPWSVSAWWHLSLPLQSTPLSLHVHPCDVPLRQRSLLGDQGMPVTQASLGSWSFNSLCWHLTKLADFITARSQLGCSSFSGLIDIIYIFRCSLCCILCFFKTPFWTLKI